MKFTAFEIVSGRARRILGVARAWVRASWRLLLVFSILINLALGIIYLVLQPIWTATAVASAVAATKAQSKIALQKAVAKAKADAEVAEQKALAKVKADAEIAERKAVASAVAKEQAKARSLRAAAVLSALATAQAERNIAIGQARANEKAKGRVRRLAVAIPVFGAAIAGGFEYWDYTKWKEGNPDGHPQDYANEVLLVTKQVAGEVYDELPPGLRPKPESLTEINVWIISWLEFLETNVQSAPKEIRH